MIPPATLAVHLLIGQVYAFSVFKNPLLDRFGTSHTSITVILSNAIVVLGVIVFGLLAYGVTETAIKAAALFTG